MLQLLNRKVLFLKSCSPAPLVFKKKTYMFALFVILIFSLVLAVVLGDVDGATSQVGQQVLDQKSRLAGVLVHANIKVCGPVR